MIESWIDRAEQPFDAAADISECPAPQVRDFEVIAQQVIAIHLDHRVEIEQGFDARGGHHDKCQVIDCCFHVGYPPDQCCQRPEKQLEIRPCEADPESLGLLWEKPRVAHVAVQRRLQINQQEPKLVNLAAKMLARQSVSKFVKGN